MKLGCQTVKRTVTCVNLLFLIVGCCLFIGVYLAENTFRFASYTTNLNNNVVETENLFILFPNVTETFFKLCHYYSLQLVLLDKNILPCVVNKTECIHQRTSVLFGRFQGESDPNIKNLVKRLDISPWKINVYNNHYKFQHGEFEIIVLAIEKRKYWYIPEWSPLNLSSFAMLQPQNLFPITLNNHMRILVPAPIKTALKNLETSKFIECKRNVAKRIRKNNPYLYNGPAVINDYHLEHMAYMRDLLQSVGVYPFLFGGTALGWYRECGVIPYTTDLDFAAFASEYNENVETVLKNDKQLSLYWILGMPNDSLELSVYVDKVKIDLFMVYESDNGSWVGGMEVPKREKLKWEYPKIEQLCTADLKGHLFNIPCNIEDIIIADYGPYWFKPHHESQFVWHSSHKNVQRNGFWISAEWPNAFRTFEKKTLPKVYYKSLNK